MGLAKQKQKDQRKIEEGIKHLKDNEVSEVHPDR